MQTINKVFLVSRGRYSDYSIIGVFLNEDLAKEYAEQNITKYDNARVECRDIMHELTTPIGFRAYNITMDIDGNSDSFEKDQIYDTSNNESIFDRSYPVHEFTNNQLIETGRYTFYVVTDKGEEGALKIANERRIELISANEWPVKGTIVFSEYTT